MNRQLFSNNAKTTITNNPLNVGDTTITLATGTGSLFNTYSNGDWELATLSLGTTNEIVKITGRSGDSLTVVRAQEGTTALSWTSGSTIEGRITKGTVERFTQFDNGGNEKGNNAVNVQSGRDTANRVASGLRTIAIGYDNIAVNQDALNLGNYGSAVGAGSISIGFNPISTGNDSISIGTYSNSDNGGGISIGYHANTSGNDAIAIGTFSNSSNVEAVSLGNRAAAKDYCTSVGSYASSAGNGDCSIGHSSSAVGTENTFTTLYAINTSYSQGVLIRTQDDLNSPIYEALNTGTSGGSIPSWAFNQYVTDNDITWRLVGQINVNNRIALGSFSRAINYDSIAIGSGALSGGYSSISLGQSVTQGGAAIALNGKAYHTDSIAIKGISRINNSLTISRSLPQLAHFPDWYHNGEPIEYTGLCGVFQTEPIDLTGGKTWTAGETVKHGQVRKPTVPDGYQYSFYDYNYIYEGIDAGMSYTGTVISNTQPTWPAIDGGSVTDISNQGDWIAINNSAYQMNLPGDFVVEEIGFIVFNYSSISVQPFISVGKVGNATAFINNQQTTNLTATKKVQRWVINNTEATNSIVIKIDTLATGTELLGRFYFKGFYVKHWL